MAVLKGYIKATQARITAWQDDVRRAEKEFKDLLPPKVRVDTDTGFDNEIKIRFSK